MYMDQNSLKFLIRKSLLVSCRQMKAVIVWHSGLSIRPRRTSRHGSPCSACAVASFIARFLRYLTAMFQLYSLYSIKWDWRLSYSVWRCVPAPVWRDWEKLWQKSNITVDSRAKFGPCTFWTQPKGHVNLLISFLRRFYGNLLGLLNTCTFFLWLLCFLTVFQTH
jgi:hypothetical protein